LHLKFPHPFISAARSFSIGITDDPEKFSKFLNFLPLAD